MPKVPTAGPKLLFDRFNSAAASSTFPSTASRTDDSDSPQLRQNFCSSLFWELQRGQNIDRLPWAIRANLVANNFSGNFKPDYESQPRRVQMNLN
jgi:hypothetical protein